MGVEETNERVRQLPEGPQINDLVLTKIRSSTEQGTETRTVHSYDHLQHVLVSQQAIGLFYTLLDTANSTASASIFIRRTKHRATQ